MGNVPGYTALTLGELVSEERFGLELVTSRDDVSDIPIYGAHAIEAPNPVAWLAEGWLMLTAGRRLRGRSDQQRQLVRELAAGKIAAMGFAVDILFSDVPAVMRDAADEEGLPILTVPYDVPFRELVAFIIQANANAELHALKRAFAIQRHLMTSIEESDPQGAIVRRLSSWLDMDVVLIDDGSDPAERVSGGPDIEQLRSHLPQRHGVVSQCAVGRWRGVAARVGGGGRTDTWIAVGGTRDFSVEHMKASIEAAVGVLNMVSHAQQASVRYDNAVRADLLREMIEANVSLSDPAYGSRLVLSGWPAGLSGRLLLISPTSGDVDAEAMRSSMADHMDREGYACISFVGDEGLVMLCSNTACEGDAVDRLADLLPGGVEGVRIGVSRVLEGADSTTLGTALADARLAIQELLLSPGATGVKRFEDLGLLSRVIAAAGLENIREPSVELLGPIRARPRLFETLKTYFESNMSVTKTSQSLFLHPNSLRYRLRQIEELADCDLRDPGAVAQLQFALRALALDPV